MHVSVNKSGNNVTQLVYQDYEVLFCTYNKFSHIVTFKNATYMHATNMQIYILDVLCMAYRSIGGI